MMKLPAFLLRAMKGASMTYREIVAARAVFSAIRNIEHREGG
jgi:hypothetical protein